MWRSLWVAVAVSVGLHAQAKFEVASLKPSNPDVRTIVHPAHGGQSYRATGATLKLLIQSAYSVVADQIAGGPDWIDHDRFDMEAKAERPSTADELHEMLRGLLADRFQLRLRNDTKEVPVYVLSVDKGGHKMTPRDLPSAAGDSPLAPWLVRPLHMKIVATGTPIDYFVRYLRYYIDLPIVDETGLKGGYDFTLEFTMEPPESMTEGLLGHDGKPIDFSGPRVAEALRKQLGLKLEPARRALPVLVVTHAEPPSDN